MLKDQYQISFRTNQKTFTWVHDNGGPKEYLQHLIDQDRIQRRDKEYLQLKYHDLKMEMAEIKKILDEDPKHIEKVKAAEIKKQLAHAPKKVNDMLNKWFESFKSNDRLMYNDTQNLVWIEEQILPDLQEVGSKLKSDQVLEIFAKYQKEGKPLIRL